MRAAVSSAATGLIVAALLAGCSRKSDEKPAEAAPPAARPRRCGLACIRRFLHRGALQGGPVFRRAGGPSRIRRQDAGLESRRPRRRRRASCARIRRPSSRSSIRPALTPAQRFEREYLEWVIDAQLFWLAERRIAVSQSGLVPRKARSVDVPHARIRAAAETPRGISRLRARRAGARRQHSRQSAHAAAARPSSNAAPRVSAATPRSSAPRCRRSSRSSPTRS